MAEAVLEAHLFEGGLFAFMEGYDLKRITIEKG